jgi:LysM repeat protein
VRRRGRARPPHAHRLSWGHRISGRAGGRYVAPAVFLLAVTGVVLLVRSSLRSDKPAGNTTPAVVSTKAATTVASPKPSPPGRYYTIRSGDTLGAIAARFSTTLDELLRLNPGIEPTALTPGEQVRIG